MRLDAQDDLLLGTTTEGVSGGDQLTIATSTHVGMTIRAGTSAEVLSTCQTHKWC